MILPEALVVHIQVTVHTQIKTATDETLEVADTYKGRKLLTQFKNLTAILNCHSTSFSLVLKKITITECPQPW